MISKLENVFAPKNVCMVAPKLANANKKKKKRNFKITIKMTVPGILNAHLTVFPVTLLLNVHNVRKDIISIHGEDAQRNIGIDFE